MGINNKIRLHRLIKAMSKRVRCIVGEFIEQKNIQCKYIQGGYIINEPYAIANGCPYGYKQLVFLGYDEMIWVSRYKIWVNFSECKRYRKSLFCDHKKFCGGK